MKKLLLPALICCICSGTHATGFKSLSDTELAKVDGQALLNFSKDAYSYTTAGSETVNFFKLGLDAEMELNTNIKSLQLGCGGVNGANGCDIDISNLALSGLPTSYDSLGNPVFANDRASTSAKITNPFVEFAIKNSDKASTREIVGFRLGAQEILGLLTTGIANTQSPTDGIQSFSGYMKIADTTGSTNTAAAKFGKAANQQISGLLDIALFGDHDFTSDPLNSATTGITVPQLNNVKFNVPGFTVTGNRQTQASATNIMVTIPVIPLAKGTAEDNANYDVYNGLNTTQFNNDQLLVNIEPCVGLGPLCLVSTSKFKMGEGSKLTNLNMNVTFNQLLSMVHNVPLTGSGGYLALQQLALHWPGADAADVAQRGWWMSFADPVQLGQLNVAGAVDISAVLPQVATNITNSLTQENMRIEIDFGNAIQALVGTPIVKTLQIDVGQWTQANPSKLTLNNQILKNQEVTSNCYGGLKFC
ncbi:hypothetical protein [Acinetobacter sp. TSRC1-2]|uniref:hypothetical protein n=1 Tax=unclassified Acinetobacter TaxID=196816 RepID=UPI003CF638E9